MASTGIGGERPDVTAALGLPAGTPVAFALALPKALAARGAIRIIAIGEQHATELVLSDAAAAQLNR